MNKKQILKIVLPSISLLVVAVIFLVISAIIGKWDVWGWMTSTQAFLIYALLILICVFTPLLIITYKVWKEKQK